MSTGSSFNLEIAPLISLTSKVVIFSFVIYLLISAAVTLSPPSVSGNILKNVPYSFIMSLKYPFIPALSFALLI